jgi:diacylglycerol kinase (ATP)
VCAWLRSHSYQLLCMSEKWFLIINPTANRGAGAKCVPVIRKILHEKNIEHEVLVTTQSSEAMPYVIEKAFECGMIVACGGDGTVHEVINGMMQAKSQNGTAAPMAALGVIPIGSGNDFVKMLNIPCDVEKAMDILIQKKTKPIDIGEMSVDGHHFRFFDNNVGIGFDAYVNYESIKIKHLKGVAIYLAAVFKSLFKYKHPTVEYSVNGEMKRRKILLMTTGNGRCSGGGFYITPNAKMDDGLFDVCVIASMNKLNMLKNLPKVMTGSHLSIPEASMYQAQEIHIRSADALPIHADGEVVSLDAHEVFMKIIPAALTAVVG